MRSPEIVDTDYLREDEMSFKKPKVRLALFLLANIG